MGLFKKKTVIKTYDKENKKPVIKASICNGEQVAGFKDITQAGSFNTLSRFYIVVEKMQTYTWFLHRLLSLSLQTEQSHQQEYG